MSVCANMSFVSLANLSLFLFDSRKIEGYFVLQAC
jgi:hypothetical protein